MKIVQIDPKENIITGTQWQTLWYDKDATGFEEKFRAEVKSAVEKSGFPDLAIEDVTVKTGGCFTPYKSEQFEAVQIYSTQGELQSFRCCFTAERFGNIMHIRIYFIANQMSDSELPAGFLQPYIWNLVLAMFQYADFLQCQYVGLFGMFFWDDAGLMMDRCFKLKSGNVYKFEE